MEKFYALYYSSSHADILGVYKNRDNARQALKEKVEQLETHLHSTKREYVGSMVNDDEYEIYLLDTKRFYTLQIRVMGFRD